VQHTYYLSLLIGIIFFQSGCIATRLLQEDEYLLGKQQIQGVQKASKHALTQYYQQQPNTKWLGAPFLLWVYQSGKHSFDKVDKVSVQRRTAQMETKFEAKIAAAAGDERRLKRLKKKRDKKRKRREKYLQEGNLLMRRGELPVIYSPRQRVATELHLLAYLYAKGYFNAQVSSVVKLRDRQATITYQIKENQPYLLGELRLNTSDKAIEKLLQDHRWQSLLRKGDAYDQEVLYQERERIYELLSNHGYFSFNRQYIRFTVDTTAADNSVVVETVIDLPIDKKAHPVFHITRVEWDVGVAQEEGVTKEQDVYHNDIVFRRLGRQFRPGVLARNVTLRPSQVYSKRALIETQRRIARLGSFRYIHTDCDVIDSNKLVSRIYTNPSDQFQFSNELGLQISHNHWLPKPFHKLSLKSNNLFRRLEVLELETHIGIEGVAALTTKQSTVSSQTYGTDLSLSWPQFLLPLRATTHTRLERLYPVTKLLLDYKYTRHPDYKQSTVTSFVRYDWQDQSRGAYVFTPLGIELTDTWDRSDEFEANLEKLRGQGNRLYKTFKPSWVTLLSLKGTFCGNTTSSTDLPYFLLTFLFESGGVLQNFINLRKMMPKLAYHQYVRFDMGYSQRIPMRSGTIFAYCINTGITHAYGREKLLPYSRYYFLGSSNGMRAWSPRSLGPGSYSAPEESGSGRSIEQIGTLLLQGSVELRQRLVGLVEGACFVDAGNIWTLSDDGCQSGQFSIRDFYKEIALGVGVGLRLNFRLLVLRLDAGFKLYDPAKSLGKRFVGRRLFSDQPALHIGIDYPF
jgi:outer membrane protein insertion porin family